MLSSYTYFSALLNIYKGKLVYLISAYICNVKSFIAQKINIWKSVHNFDNLVRKYILDKWLLCVLNKH